MTEMFCVVHHDLLPVPDLQVGPARQRPQLLLDPGHVALALGQSPVDGLFHGLGLLAFLSHWFLKVLLNCSLKVVAAFYR